MELCATLFSARTTVGAITAVLIEVTTPTGSLLDTVQSIILGPWHAPAWVSDSP